MAAAKHADPSTRADVDEMILDYLLYMATASLLSERRAAKALGTNPSTNTGSSLPTSHQTPDLPLRMIDSFLPLFKASHPDPLDGKDDDASLRFRLRLSKFTTLYTRRCTPSPTTPSPAALTALRATNSRRANRWWRSSRPHDTNDERRTQTLEALYADFSLPTPLVERNRAHVLEQLHHFSHSETDGGEFYGTRASVSLLDVLPSFMALCAARAALSGDVEIGVHEQLMRLCVEFMLQAALEQWRCFGERGWGGVGREAFAWGWWGARGSERGDVREVGEEWEDEELVRGMFADEDEDREVEGWEGVWREGFHKVRTVVCSFAITSNTSTTALVGDVLALSLP